MKKLLIIFAIFFVSISSHASFIASNNKKIDPDLPTHVLLAGNPDKLGGLFIYSLLTKAKIYQEISPAHQIVIVGRSEDQKEIKSAGFNIIDTKIGMLKPGVIKSAIKNIKLISSIDIFAHSNALSGITLDSNTWVYPLLNEKDDLWELVKDRINDSSFIFIHGCNAGIKLAPLLAKKLKIAVFAALTSTDFQYIYQDQFWSFEYHPEANARSAKNNFNYASPRACGKYCTRMRPDNFSYRGHWGDWAAGGYPTYKLFCGTNNNANCEKGALESLFSFPGKLRYVETKKNMANFKEQVLEFMCPFSHNVEEQDFCKKNLENSLSSEMPSTYSPFKGQTLNCDREICKARFNCSGLNAAFNADACKLENESINEPVFTFSEEFKYFISIYKKHYQ